MAIAAVFIAFVIMSGMGGRLLAPSHPYQNYSSGRMNSMAKSQFTLLNLIDKWCNAGQHFVQRNEFSKNAAKSDGLQVRCKKCQSAYHSRNRQRLREQGIRYRAANKERIAAHRRDYYEQTREEQIERARKWHQENRDVVIARRKAAYDANPDFYRKQKRDWYQANLEKMKLINRRAYERKRDKPTYKAALRRQGKIYYQRHPNKVKAKAHRRRAAKGVFTSTQWASKCEYWGWRCYLCTAPLTLKTATVDHRKPLIRGGSNWIANIAPACRYCNAVKRDLSEADYRKKIQAGLTRIIPLEMVRT